LGRHLNFKADAAIVRSRRQRHGGCRPLAGITIDPAAHVSLSDIGAAILPTEPPS
jgi:hypothetical protein